VLPVIWRRSLLFWFCSASNGRTWAVDAMSFSSDGEFISEYGFSDRGGDGKRGEHATGGPSEDREILVSEYGVSAGFGRRR
jgi:hypothetical protein